MFIVFAAENAIINDWQASILGVHLKNTNIFQMDAEAEPVEETTEVMAATETPSQEEPSSDNKFR